MRSWLCATLRSIRILILARKKIEKKMKKKNETKKIFWFFFLNFLIFFTFRQLILVMGVFTRFMGSPDCNFMKITGGSLFSRLLEKTFFTGVLGVWMTIKKAERPKSLGMGLVWVKQTPSTTCGWILGFSRDWYCTSFN